MEGLWTIYLSVSLMKISSVSSGFLGEIQVQMRAPRRGMNP